MKTVLLLLLILAIGLNVIWFLCYSSLTNKLAIVEASYAQCTASLVAEREVSTVEKNVNSMSSDSIRDWLQLHKSFSED